MTPSSAQTESPMSRQAFGWIICGVAACGVAVVAFMLSGGNAATEMVDLGELSNEEIVQLGKGVVDGDGSAKITIMEFGNYECPACATFALRTKPQIDLAYTREGIVQFRYHDFAIGFPHEILAARAARCAGDQGRYFEYHDEVFRTQAEWAGPGSGAAGHFSGLARQLGLDRDAFESCLNSDEHADVVTANTLLGQRLGVTGTPTLFLRGEDGNLMRLGGSAFIDVQAAIDEILNP